LLADQKTLEFCPTHPFSYHPGLMLNETATFLIENRNERYSTDDLITLTLPVPAGISIKEVTGNDEQSFLQRIKSAKSDEKVCFHSDVSMWPVHGGSR
jgi:hypothetical protein